MCQDDRMPRTPMTLHDARDQAKRCDERWPECGPHRVEQGVKARNGYE